MAVVSRRLSLVKTAENTAPTQLRLRNFLSSEKGRTMLKGHGFRRAFLATPQRVNEAHADYGVNLHPLGRKGLFKPAGSIEVTQSGLLVKHNGERNAELDKLGVAIAGKLHLAVKYAVV